MIVKKKKKQSFIVPTIIFLVLFYFVLRVMSLVSEAGEFDIEMLNTALNTLYKLNTPLILSRKNIMISVFIAGFVVLFYESYILSQKENIQEKTYGSSEWQSPKVLDKKKSKNIEENIILTKTEQVSKNPKISKMNRHILLIGRPGTGKSKFFLEPNILNATGSLVITDPKGELLRDCGNVLKMKGYDIKVLNLDNKAISNFYNPFEYIRKVYTTMSDEDIDEYVYSENSKIKEDDVMTLINVLIKNTKSSEIDTQTGDPFWEKAEILLLQSLFYYILEEHKDDPLRKNIPEVLNLMRKAMPNESGISELDILFEDFAHKYGEEHIAVKQWLHFKAAQGAKKMIATIIMMATSRLACFNINEVKNLVLTDNIELDRLGMPIDEDELEEINKSNPKKSKNGKVAIFVIIKPSDPTFNFIASMMYTQIFQVIDENAVRCGGTLATPVDLYLDEFAQLGEIPNFKEELAYVRGLNVGIVISIQSLSQLKQFYKETWETIIDCCDTTILLGSNSETTLKYFETMLGKKTWYKKSSGRTFSRQGSSSQNWDIVGRELANMNEINMMGYGKCIVLIPNVGVFFSDLYDIKVHPYYKFMYDSWNKDTKKNIYIHNPKGTKEDEISEIFSLIGIKNCKVIPKCKFETVNEKELEKIADNVYTAEEVLKAC